MLQLIYDFKDGGGTFGLLSLHPEEIVSEDKEKFKKIGVDIPSMLYVPSPLVAYRSITACTFRVMCINAYVHACTSMLLLCTYIHTYIHYFCSDLYSRNKLDSYLSRALNVPLDSKNRLSIIDDSRYVLTLDFAIKMLNIHERAECGVPVIIEGETGVGKTALIEMLSKLWNFSLIRNWSLYKERILDFIQKKLDGRFVNG